MSKKMAKRSLALGALMAFVITGSAMAAAVENKATANDAIAIGSSAVASEKWGVAIGANAEVDVENAVSIGRLSSASGNGSVALGLEANASAYGSVAVGQYSQAIGSASVAIGAGSTENPGATANGAQSVAIGNRTVSGFEAVAVGQLASANYQYAIAVGSEAKTGGAYSIAMGRLANATAENAVAIGGNTIAGKGSVALGRAVEAGEEKSVAIGYNTKAVAAGDIAIGAYATTGDVVSVDNVNIGGQTYSVAGNDVNGKVLAASIGGVTTSSAFDASADNPKTIYRQLQNVAAGQVTAESTDAVNGSQLFAAYEAIEATQASTGAAISGINQRLHKTNAKINKVGAGAAALAALHPLEYDPDDKLTFSAGMGNYAGENAAALGAFYRPNEKFMVSLGGTMGNGENMVNLGLSIGLDKPNAYTKLSKRELIQKVNAVEAENEAMKAEMAEMKAMLQEILAKK